MQLCWIKSGRAISVSVPCIRVLSLPVLSPDPADLTDCAGGYSAVGLLAIINQHRQDQFMAAGAERAADEQMPVVIDNTDFFRLGTAHTPAVQTDRFLNHGNGRRLPYWVKPALGSENDRQTI